MLLSPVRPTRPISADYVPFFFKVPTQSALVVASTVTVRGMNTKTQFATIATEGDILRGLTTRRQHMTVVTKE